MRLFILNIFIFIVPIFTFGQLHTLSDYYVYDALAINPAFAGSQGALSASMFYRSYLTGFEGAPKTISASVHAPLDKEKIGVGLLISNNSIGISHETSFIGNYAYRLNLGYGKLAMGLGIGLSLQKTNWDDLAAHDPNDELLADNSYTYAVPDFSAGFYYSTRNYFVGFSVPFLLNHTYNSTDDKYLTRNDFSEYNYFCNAGYNYDLSPDFTFLPSLLIKYHKGNTTQIDLNSQIIYKNRFWLGLSYRSKKTLIGMLQFQVNDQFRIAYAYDYILGRNGQYNYNSNEIMLNYLFSYKAKVADPRQF
jgi:type IX secretion system PorP/SprF family membrane protein